MSLVVIELTEFGLKTLQAAVKQFQHMSEGEGWVGGCEQAGGWGRLGGGGIACPQDSVHEHRYSALWLRLPVRNKPYVASVDVKQHGHVNVHEP